MLEHLRKRIADTLGAAHTATFITNGAAGLQSSALPCEACDLDLYLLAPRLSDHLVNLDLRRECMVIGDAWQVRGQARVVARDERPTNLKLTLAPDAPWSEIVRVSPQQFQVIRPDGWGYSETIDIE